MRSCSAYVLPRYGSMSSKPRYFDGLSMSHLHLQPLLLWDGRTVRRNTTAMQRFRDWRRAIRQWSSKILRISHGWLRLRDVGCLQSARCALSCTEMQATPKVNIHATSKVNNYSLFSWKPCLGVPYDLYNCLVQKSNAMSAISTSAACCLCRFMR